MGPALCKAAAVEDALHNISVYEEIAIARENRKSFEALHLDEHDVAKLFAVFTSIDTTGTSELTLNEFLKFANLPLENSFVERVFAIMDDDENGTIDFREFVVSVWNYCSLSQASLSMFAFDLYDRDGSGEIDTCEVEEMLQDIYGAEWKAHQPARRVMNSVERLRLEEGEEEVCITPATFSSFTKHHTELLRPAFRMQRILQEKICGVDFWKKCSSERQEIGNGKYITVNHILQAQKKAMNHLIHQDMVVKGGSDGKQEVMVPAAAAILETGTHEQRRQQDHLQQGNGKEELTKEQLIAKVRGKKKNE
uniref:EF-hand domain-containing protein n=1 Tax=Phaeomonas parva TaxID=124430 RepID=A0A7S1UAP5_9STRA|mmetsp:Transcript_36406/g.114112  ORF Transcript_36406/g.114112 Transcript_36406/m.114112 type:complete len:309 (+) Transcript_36406:186-1112(+)